MTIPLHRPIHFDKNQDKLFNFIYDEVFIKEEYSVDIKRKEPVIFDCGANIGLTTLYFSEKYPGATIVAFEPNPSAVVYFNRNTEELKSSGQLTLYQVALGDENTLRDFYPSAAPGSVVASFVFKLTGPKIPVTVRKLSDFVMNYDFIDLVKIDIEGAESEVVRDLVKSEAINRIDQLLIEYHQPLDQPEGLDQFIELLTQPGLTVKIRSKNKTSLFNAFLLHCYRG